MSPCQPRGSRRALRLRACGLSTALSCRSTAYHFNPKPASPRFLSHSLVELLNQISPTFKKNFAVLQKKR